MNASLSPSLTLICVARRGQAVVDEQKPQTCFARRLSTSVHQRKRNPSAPDAAGTSISMRQLNHVVERHTCRGCQRIEMSNRDVAGEMSGDVQGGARSTRDG